MQLWPCKKKSNKTLWENSKNPTLFIPMYSVNTMNVQNIQTG